MACSSFAGLDLVALAVNQQPLFRRLQIQLDEVNED
jgi:hypothetical protein